MRLRAEATQALDNAGIETQRVEPQALHLVGDGLLVEHTEHGVFAVNTWNNGNAEVDGAAFDDHLEAAVLRHTPLGNVELRHYLDTRDDLFWNIKAANRTHLRQYAVDTVADDQTRRGGLEMNIAGTAAQGIEQRGVHQLDDRAGILTDGSETEGFNLTTLVGSALRSFQRGVDGTHRLLVAGNEALHIATGRHGPAEGFRNAGLEPRAQRGIEWVGDDGDQVAALTNHDATAP